MSTAPESELTSASATPAAVNENAAAELFAQANLYLAKQTKPVIIPSFAKWFNMNEIHEIEKKSLPEFFSSQSNQKYKNPDIYKSVRDFIVNTYRLNPIEYLSVTAIRRNIAMDVGSLMRIYAFLSKWGIINYQIDPKTKSFAVGPQFTGHFQITLDKPSGFQLQAFESKASEKEETETAAEKKEVVDDVASNDDTKMDVDEPDLKKQKVSNSITPNTKLNLQLRRNVYDSVDDALILQDSNANSSKQVKRMYCAITGNDITETKYHNLKNKSNISLECYQNSQFEDYFKNTDFVRIDKINLNNDSTPWSNNEILLLLEGIEMFGDDWNLISGHVGSRPKDQCIIKFIQLPVEDSYLFKQISKSSYVEYLKKLKSDKTIDLSALLSKANDSIQIQQTQETTTKSTTTITRTSSTNENIKEHVNTELACQDKIITSILKLALRKFELKLQSFINLESLTSEEKKLIESERENLNLDKLKVKKQCNKVRQQLLKASDIVQVVKADSEITPEGIESAISEAIGLIDRAISEAKYDPNAESSLVTKKAEKLESEEVAENQTPATEDDFEPISVVEPKLFTVWSA